MHPPHRPPASLPPKVSLLILEIRRGTPAGIKVQVNHC